MYGNSTFDPNAAFAGGGYMPSQATQTVENSIAPSKNREAQALLPLTVKQISQALQPSTDAKADFQVDGVGLSSVRLVGRMCEKLEKITDISFVLDDGTGRFPCIKWINGASEDESELTPLMNGTYVTVHGQLKGFQGKKQLNVFSVRPVTDFNEITYHFAECIYVHCYNTKLRKTQAAGQVPCNVSTSDINTPSKGYQSAANQILPLHPKNFSVRVLISPQYTYMSATKSPIIKAPMAPGNNSERGAHRNDIVQHLKPHASEHLIFEAIESLVNEGLVYSTTDDNHYKTTANG